MQRSTSLQKFIPLPLFILSLIGLSSFSLAAVNFTSTRSGLTIKNNTNQSFEAGARCYTNTSLFPNYTAELIRKSSYNGQSFSEFMGKSPGNTFLGAGQSNQLVIDWQNSLATFPGIPLLKTGVCNAPEPPCDEPAITNDELSKLINDPKYYNASYRYKGGDLLGKKGGKYNANILDSYCGETQIQFAIPPSSYTWSLSNTNVKFDENNGGSKPLIWMSLAGVQEYYNMDAQVMIASGMKESWFLTSGRAVMANVSSGGLSPFHIEMFTFSDQLNGMIPGLYPFGLTYDRYLGGVGTAEGVKTTDGELAINGVLSSGLLWRGYYDQLKVETDLGWKQVLENSSTNGDPLIGLCFMASMYNQGPAQDSLHKILKPDNQGGELSRLLDNVNACNYLQSSPGVGSFGNYLTALRDNAIALETASKNAETNSSINIVERWITWDDVITFWFGKGGSPAMASKDQQGGLLLHYNITSEVRQAIFDELKTAFNTQSAHWPTQNGKAVISLRYDWLSNLRIAKNKINRQIVESYPDFRQTTISTFSSSGYSGDGERIDNGYPFARIENKQLSGDFIFDVIAEDPFYVASDAKQQDRGIESVEWSTDINWSVWHNDGVTQVDSLRPRQIGTQTGYLEKKFTVKIPENEISALNGSSGGGIVYIKVRDLCGNAVVLSETIAGSAKPKLTLAEMYDNNGDGKADSLVFNGADNDTAKFANFSANEFTWNGLTKSGSVRGQYFIIDNSLDFSSEDPASGTLTLTYGNGKISKLIDDKIAPIIKSASVRERSSNADKDTLTISFSKKFTGIDSTTTAKFLEFFGVHSGLGLPEQIFSVKDKSIRLIYPGGSITPDQDSVKILASGPIMGLYNNMKAHPNNPKVVIRLDKGPISVLADGANYFLDKNADGTMDQFQIQFARDLDPTRLEMMEFKYKWKTGSQGNVKEFSILGNSPQVSVNGDIVTIKPLASDSLTSDLTYFNNSDNSGWGFVSVAQPDGDTSLVRAVNMKDKMGPVVADAEIILTPSPTSKPDKLAIRFSEPLKVADISGTQMYEFKSGDVVKNYPHSNELNWKNDMNLTVLYTPDIQDRPVIGDSVHIKVQNNTSEIVDSYGNVADNLNKYEVIRGKQIITYNSANMYTFDASVVTDKEAFGDPVFYSNATLFIPSTSDPTLPSIINNEQKIDTLFSHKAGVGFNISFNLSDASQANIDPKSIQFEYTLAYYSNLGEVVAYKKGHFSCLDMKNITNPCDRYSKVKVFIPWNFKSNAGTPVASGVYIQQVSVSSGTIQKTDESKRIGITRNALKEIKIPETRFNKP